MGKKHRGDKSKAPTPAQEAPVKTLEDELELEDQLDLEELIEDQIEGETEDTADTEADETADEATEDETEETDTADEDVEETEEEVEAVPNETPRQKKARLAHASRVKAGDVVVKDGSGRALFKRNAPTLPAPVYTKPKQKDPGKSAKRRLEKPNKDGVHANYQYLALPTDRWGVTRETRNAIKNLASRIAGDERKYELAKATLKVLLGHLEAKYQVDNEYKEKRKAEAIAKAEAEKAEREAKSKKAE